MIAQYLMYHRLRCVFYTGENFTGNWFCESGERTVNKLNKAPWKDNIESIKLFNGASVKIYNEYDRMGDRELVSNSIGLLHLDFLNRLRSYRTVMPEQEEYILPVWWMEVCRYRYEY